MLEERVVVVTGAGRGIGREHALLFGKLGAKVVVNDLGGQADGTGNDLSAAAAVVAEIRAAGGDAVADTSSVADFKAAEQLIARAVDTYGRLDAVVNNAGILRDKMLVSMSERDFDDVIAVHLKGTFNISHHAATYWRGLSKDGDVQPRAIVNTSSGSGLHGNVGQTNYAAAKAGIATMTLVHARELERYGVVVNAIAPIARTRLTLQTPGMSDRVGGEEFAPENIAPLAAYLASARCAFNGQVFSVYGGTVAIYGGWSAAARVTTEGRWSVEDLADAMESELPTSVDSKPAFTIMS